MSLTFDPRSLGPRALVGSWLELWAHGAAVGRGTFAAAAILCDTRAWRDLWLGHLSRSTDLYLRSPAFMELMGSSLKAMNKSTPSP
jgi:hypothetical protein